ncbi:hypothetical protein [Vibrio owensii]|uniref:hypothetical protein n=1 Tax=Vibrio owensii TaxID=696485 RepID=UPI004067E3CE
MNKKRSRGDAQVRAEKKYDEARSSLPRFGGRCSTEEKNLLLTMTKEEGGITEKELIFLALNYYRQRNKND